LRLADGASVLIIAPFQSLFSLSTAGIGGGMNYGISGDVD